MNASGSVGILATFSFDSNNLFKFLSNVIIVLLSVFDEKFHLPKLHNKVNGIRQTFF